MELFRAIDEGNAGKVKEILERMMTSQPRASSVQKLLDEGFRLALAGKHHLGVLELILMANPTPSLVEDSFNRLAHQGATPCTIRILQKYIHREMLLEATRRHARSRYQNFYIVDILEEDAYNTVLKAFEKRFCKDTKGKAPVQKMLNQAWVNDIFLEEVRSDHRYIVQLLLHPTNPSYLKPDRTTIGRALRRALSRHTFGMASMLLESTESAYTHLATAATPKEHEHKGLRVNQDDLDQAFREALQTQDAPVLDWLIHTHNMLVSVPTLEHYYALYIPNLPRGVDAKSLFIHSVLDRLVSREHKEKVHLAAERRRRVAAQLSRLARGVSTDIHDFSRAVVRDPTADANAAASSDSRDEEDEGRHGDRRTLNRAVQQYLEQQVPSHLVDPPAALRAVLALVPTLFPTAEGQEAAERTLSEGLTAESLRLLGVTVAYLQTAHPAHHSDPSLLALWLQGFLVESVQVRSCNPGMQERIVTGLRGVADPQLDRIFQQVEGPSLARYFLSHTFNLLGGDDDDDDDDEGEGQRRRGGLGVRRGAGTRARTEGREKARALAKLLYDRGFRDDPSSTGPGLGWEEQVKGILRSYALEKVGEYLGGGEVGAQFRSEVDAVAEVVQDCYEGYIRKHVLELCRGEDEHTDDTNMIV